MVITKTTPYTKDEIEQLKEAYGSYIKTVIDVEKKICVSGVVMHVDGEQLLLSHGSNQRNIWGGGIDAFTNEIDFQSMINIRPSDENHSNVITSSKIQLQYRNLTTYFFTEIYGK